MGKSNKANIPIEKTKIDEEEDDFDFTKAMIQNGNVNLELAGIFFISAHQQYNQGCKIFTKLEKAIIKYDKDYEERVKKFEILNERFYIPQFRKIRDMEVLYEPVVRHFSAVKILLGCCVEAYINVIAADELSGRKFEEFDKLSVIGKWLFIQDILKFKKRITLDQEPLQGVAILMKQRNKLVHFKGAKKSFFPLKIPTFLNDLGLTPTECLKNINSVRNLIIKFNSISVGGTGPYWLFPEDDAYRNPCFSIGSAQHGVILYSQRIDKKRF